MKISKKEKIYILLVIVVIQVLGISYLIFSNISKKAVIEIAEQNNNLIQNVENSKSEKDSLFTNTYPEYAFLFDQNYNIENAIYYTDTTIRFFLYSRKIKVAKFHSEYYDCLTQKCKNEIVLSKAKISIDSLLSKLNNQFGGVTYSCYNLLDSNLFYIKDTFSINCENVYTNFTPYILNKLAFEDFKAFVKQYRNDSIEIAKESNKNVSTYKRNFNSLKRLNISNISSIAENKASEYIMLSETNQQFDFESNVFGTVSYSFPLKEFNETKFNTVKEEILEDQYRYNSLANGSQPYASCFGRNRGCSGWNCSQIKVVASRNSDVLVTIKNSTGKVVRHAYIKAGYSYTFQLPNGRYQPFFYYGTGWHPKKFMKKTDCGNLYGGFIANEHVGKDNYQQLYNQILTYTLIEQINGNFNTRPSSKNEAF